MTDTNHPAATDEDVKRVASRLQGLLPKSSPESISKIAPRVAAVLARRGQLPKD